MFLAVSSARSWNCSDPLASRVDVGTTKPAGTAGDADGQYYIGSDAANPKDYYVCEVPKPPVTPPPTAPSQTQTQSQTQSSNSNSASTANSTSSSTAKSASTSNSNSNSNAAGGSATATGGAGGTATSTAKGGNATGGNATGGSVSGSGNSTVKNTLANKLTNSGNSQNTNTLSASGGQQSQTATGGSQTQTTSSAASNNGNGANNSTYSSNTSVAASKIPVDTAFAYAAQPTVNCALTYGAGGQGATFGLSLSGTKIDKNCADLEAARKAPNKLAYCKVYIRNDYVRKAGVTLEDCMIEDKTVVVAAPVPVAAIAPPPTIIVNIPAQVAPVPVIPALTTTVTLRDFGTCNVLTQSNVCKQELSSAVRLLLTSGNGRIVLTGPVESGKLIPYIVSKGLSASRVELKLSDDQNSTVTVQTFTEKAE